MYIHIKILKLFLVILLFCFNLSLSAETWNIETVDASGQAEGGPAIAVDSQGKIHIAFRTSTWTLRYATNTSGQWVVSTIDVIGSVNPLISMAVDSQDHIHIAYSTAVEGHLKYISNTSSSWSIEDIWTPFHPYDVDDHLSLAIDNAGKAHIAYYKHISQNRGSLNYVTNVSGEWHNQIQVDGSNTVDAGRYPAIKFSNTQWLYIAYRDVTNRQIKLATKSPTGEWQLESTGADGHSLSLDLDDAGLPHISYVISNPVGDFEYDGDLKYLIKAIGRWQDDLVDASNNVRYVTSIAGASLAKARIAYTVLNENTAVYYATNGTGSWLSQVIDNTGRPSNATIVLDSNYGAHVTYIAKNDQNVNEIRYAHANPLTPLAPSNLEAHYAVYEPGTIDLSWTDNSHNEDGFRLEYKWTPAVAPAGWRTLATVDANATTYQMQDAQSGSTYYFRAQAVNNHGASPFSNVVTLLVRYIFFPIWIVIGIITFVLVVLYVRRKKT